MASASTLDTCSRCGFEAAKSILQRGLCQPCREWRDTSGPAKAGATPSCGDDKYISIGSLRARAGKVYGYVPRFILGIIKTHVTMTVIGGEPVKGVPLSAIPERLRAKAPADTKW